MKAFGENIGAFLGIFGTYQSVLIFMILLVSDNPYQVNRMVSSLNLGFLSLSGVTIFVYPILGIGIMMFFKFLSERIFVSLSLEKSTYLLIKEKKETAEPVASTEKVL